MTHPQDLPLREQAAGIARGALDPAAVLDATFARIAERDPPLNSMAELFPDRARRMLAEAPPGPLSGVPVTVKDMFSLPWRGQRNGTSRELLPASASGVYRRLRDAGAVIVGVANQHLLGAGATGTVSAYGPHRNPWDPERVPGGSSGGSAIAVAARLVAGSVASDSGGSTRIPAAWCGVVGLKVTFRSVPYDGYFGAATWLSAPGVIARDAADTRLLASALLARPLPGGDGARLRAGVVPDLWDDLDPGVAAACRAVLDASGWTVSEVALPGTDLGATVFRALMAAGSPSAPPPEVLDELPPAVRAGMLAGLLTPAWVIARAERLRVRWRRALADLFGTVDVLVWPTVPAPAPPLADPTITLPRRGRLPADLAAVVHTVAANVTGVPAVSVPVGSAGHGLPVGLQLLAPWGAEGRLLDAAAHLEAVTDRRWVDAAPPVAR